METERHSDAAESSATESWCNVVNIKEILFQRARNQKKLCKSMELCQVGRYAESIRLQELERLIESAGLKKEYERWCRNGGNKSTQKKNANP